MISCLEINCEMLCVALVDELHCDVDMCKASTDASVVPRDELYCLIKLVWV